MNLRNIRSFSGGSYRPFVSESPGRLYVKHTEKKMENSLQCPYHIDLSIFNTIANSGHAQDTMRLAPV